MNNKKKKPDVIGKIPNWAWLILSLLVAILVWTLLSSNPVTSRAFPPLTEVFGSYTKMAAAKEAGGRGVFWGDILSSLTSAGIGFALRSLSIIPSSTSHIFQLYGAVSRVVKSLEHHHITPVEPLTQFENILSFKKFAAASSSHIIGPSVPISSTRQGLPEISA